MKKLAIIGFIVLAIISCQNDDSTDHNNNQVSFEYEGKRVELDSFYINDIMKISTNEVIGKHISAYNTSLIIDNKTFVADFYFYTTNDIYELYSTELNITENFSSGGVTSITTSYENNFLNDTDLPFNHNIEKNNDKLEGSFNGKLADHALYDTITVSQGKIRYQLP